MPHPFIDSISPALTLVGIGIAGAVFILLLCLWKGWQQDHEWQTGCLGKEREPLKSRADALRLRAQQERSAKIRSFSQPAKKGIDWRGGNNEPAA